MDSKQAATTLRTIIDARRMHPIDKDQLEFAEAEERGADAIEMLEWLLQESGGIHRAWLIYRTADEPFRTYCEARFREYKKGLTT